MQSTQWQIDSFGRDQLRQASVPLRDPGPTEIVVAVKAVSLNYRDLLMLDNGMGMPLPMPFVPASDLSGEVIALGREVTRFEVGDRVLSTFWAGWMDGERPADARSLGGPGPGVMATHVVLEQQWAVRGPRQLTHAQASTLPCAGLTAWTALVEHGGLRAGQAVLLHGTGGVSLFGLQWARLHGAQAFVLSGSEEKLARVQALGATQGLLRGQGDWRLALREHTGGRGVDQVLETVGGTEFGDSVAALAPGGSVSVVGMLAGAELHVPFYAMVLGRATVRGISVGHRRGLEEVVRAADATALVPVIDTPYGFDELPQALDHLARGAFGKVVLTV